MHRDLLPGNRLPLSSDASELSGRVSDAPPNARLQHAVEARRARSEVMVRWAGLRNVSRSTVADEDPNRDPRLR